MFVHWFINFGVIHDYLVYGVIVITSFFEGPILALLCGLLLRMGFLAIIPVYISLMLGDLLGDTVWYWIGYRFGPVFVKRFGRYFHVNEDNVKTVERIFRKHSSAILIVSKLTMGLGFALVTLITAGMARIPFHRYIMLNVIGQFVWTALLLSSGFFLGQLYVTFDNIFARISIIAFAVIVIVAIFRYAKFVRNRITGAEQIIQ